jgi:carbonic anhydrase
MSRTVLIRQACFIVFGFFVCTRPVPARAADAGTQAAPQHHPASPSLTPQQALDRLMEGNRRFVEGRLQHPHQTQQWRAGLTTGQHPIAAILGCSDSRVPVEELFDQGFGDVFVIRVAGNVAAEDERGSIEYAVAHLDVPLCSSSVTSSAVP